MQKQGPTLGRLLTMTVFALSCFGLMLFMWVSFGGPIPLKPKGYQVTMRVPDTTQLGLEADVRVSGVPVGKVRKKVRDPHGNATLVTIEMQEEHAPLARDARAVLRQKTLLGETYVELTLGDKGPRGENTIPEGGRLADKQVTDHVELEDILNTFDPATRRGFRAWQQDGGEAVRRRGQDLNESLGNLPEFIESGDAMLRVLAADEAALGGMFRDTGATFEALTRREDKLRALMVNVDDVFTATASQREALRETIARFPGFLVDSRRALARLERFAETSTPTFARTADAMQELPPTLDALARFAPDLERALTLVRPLSRASSRSLPATVEILRELKPMLGELGPFLGELNPILGWVGLHSNTLSDMIGTMGWGTAAKAQSADPRSPGHYARQSIPTGAETAAFWPTRLPSNRGNAYPEPLALAGRDVAQSLIFPSFDCASSGEKPATTGPPASPACREQKPLPRLGRFPHVDRAGGSR